MKVSGMCLRESR